MIVKQLFVEDATEDQEMLIDLIATEQRVLYALGAPIAEQRIDRSLMDYRRQKEMIDVARDVSRLRLAALETMLIGGDNVREIDG